MKKYKCEELVGTEINGIKIIRFFLVVGSSGKKDHFMNAFAFVVKHLVVEQTTLKKEAPKVVDA